MTPDRLQKLIRLMMLTTSNRDGEALAALRKAQAFLAEGGQNWEEFLTPLANGKAPPREEPKAQAHQAYQRPPGGGWQRSKPAWDEYEDAETMIEYLIESGRLPDSLVDFVTSLQGSLAKYGRLTENQMRALRNIYRRNN
jgi:hypothetical protein